MFLIPAAGVPNEYMLQDTLKASIFAICTFLAALLLAYRNIQSKSRLRFHAALFLPLTLAIFALFSMSWGHAYLAAGEAIRWALVFTLAWICANFVSLAPIKRLLWGIHWGCVIASLWAILQYWAALDWFPQAAFPASTFANRNFFAEYAVCALPYSIWLLLQCTSKRWAVSMAMSLALCIVGIIAAGTRSALIALLLLAIAGVVASFRLRYQLHWFTWPHKTKLMALLAFVGVVTFFDMLPSANPLVQQSGNGHSLAQRLSLRASSLYTMDEYSKGSFSERVVMWKATVRMIIANPFAGVGAGAWEAFIPLYQEADTNKEFDYFAHNDVLQILSEYGLPVGGLFWAFFLAFALKWAENAWSRTADIRPERSLRTFALFSLLMILVVASAGFPLHLAPCCAVLGLSLGTLASTDREFTPLRQAYIRDFVVNSPTRVLALGLTMAGLLGAITISIQAIRAENMLVRALVLATDLLNARSAHRLFGTSEREQLLNDVYGGIAINPHYRKLAPVIADRLAAAGELEDAVRIWHSTAQSRPYIAALWSNLALGYSNIGRHEEAWAALERFHRLRPTKPENISIEIALRRNAGDIEGALRIVRRQFRDDNYDFSIVQTAYETAVLARDWVLAIEALERRNQSWPELMADGWLQLGLIYRLPEVNQPQKAQAAFSAGLLATDKELQERYRNKVPLPYRNLL